MICVDKDYVKAARELNPEGVIHFKNATDQELF